METKKAEEERCRRTREEIDWEAIRKEFEAERIHRETLQRSASRADGDKLRQKIETDDEMVVALEIPASLRAKCRAKEDCLYIRANSYTANAITDDYRICVHGVENEDWFGRTKHYYHVSCFSSWLT